MNYNLVFDEPSSKFSEGLPCGNGRLGATVLGSIQEKHIILNEETVWYGGPRDRNNPDTINYINKIKTLMLDEKITEAERLSLLALTGTPESQRHYTTLGRMVMDFNNHKSSVKNYKHCLDLETATVKTSYTMGEIDYEMKVFVSAVDQVMVVQIEASKPVLDFFAGIERGERVIQFSYGTHMDAVKPADKNGLLMKGSCGGENGLIFRGALFASSEEGTQTIIGDKLVFEKCKAVTLYFAAGTNYNDDKIEDTCIKRCKSALNLGYEACKKRHLEEWESTYKNVNIQLEHLAGMKDLPSLNKIFNAINKNDWAILKENADKAYIQNVKDNLVILLFNYGRYILASTSRNCELPANLQGLWCQDLLPIWDCKFTTNINLQMNYWGADVANLSKCFEPYLKLSKRIRENGSITAKKMYGCEGFVLHNNTDIWADTAPQDMGLACTYWFTGGAWIAADMWEHYLYTKDLNYLKEAWPIIRDAAKFMIDYMVEKNGKLVMCPSSSPENSYISKNGERNSFCIMPAMDIELISLLFNNCKSAIKAFKDENFENKNEIENGFEEKLNKAISMMPSIEIAKDGTIMEWTEEVEEAEPSHRHLSHLIGVYPYYQITEDDDILYKAVKKSIDKRVKNGGCNNGWSKAWGSGIYARLKDGNKSRDMIVNMIEKSSQPNLLCCCNVGRTPKLIEDSMPMQVDGNNGVVRAVSEMLIQSYDDEVKLIPALPSNWENGSFDGLVAKGNIVINAVWKKRKIVDAKLQARANGTCILNLGEEYKIFKENSDECIKPGNGNYRICYSKDDVYHITKA